MHQEAMDEDGSATATDPNGQSARINRPDQLPPPMFARGVAVRPRHMKATPRAPAPQLPSPLAYFARGAAGAGAAGEQGQGEAPGGSGLAQQNDEPKSGGASPHRPRF